MASPLVASDLILVLAGRSERHGYGLQLWRDGAAPRLVLSIGRFDARQVAGLLPDNDQFTKMLRATPAVERHFFADLSSEPPRYRVAKLFRRGTYPELQALASYLEQQRPATITVVSTSIHLRRVRYCCRRIPFFLHCNVHYMAVPEATSSFQQRDWWKHFDHWSYVTKEYAKLLVYSVLYRGTPARPNRGVPLHL